MIYGLKVKTMVSQIVLHTLINIIDVMVKKDQQVQCNLIHKNPY